MQTQNPASPNLFQEASLAWQRRDFQKTIDLLKHASQQQPGNSKLRLNLGEAYGLRFEYGKAALCFEQAVAAALNKVDVLAEAGRRCERFRQPAMANRFFKRAAEHPGVDAAVLVALAEFEEGHSRVDAALMLLQRVLDAQPNHPAALVARARLHRASGELERGEELLRSLVRTAAGEVAAKAWFELGTNLDRQANYGAAMEAFLQAKSLVGPAVADASVDVQETLNAAPALEQSLSADTLRRWVAAGAELQPQRHFAFLCGHPRSGTTLLEQVLDAHPAIVATDESPILFREVYPDLCKALPETTFELDILESASIDLLQKARADHFRFTEAFLDQPIGNRFLIDKNPSMDLRIPIVARIFPETRFLVALRDPRDVCLSCFMLPLTMGQMGALYLTLEQTVFHYITVMGFSRAVRQKLPSPQLEIRYEDSVQDLEKLSRRVLAFLGVDWDPAILEFHQHAKKKLLRCGVDEAVAKPVFKSSVGRWRHYQVYLEPYLKTLEPFVKAFGYE